MVASALSAEVGIFNPETLPQLGFRSIGRPGENKAVVRTKAGSVSKPQSPTFQRLGVFGAQNPPWAHLGLVYCVLIALLSSFCEPGMFKGVRFYFLDSDREEGSRFLKVLRN